MGYMRHHAIVVTSWNEKLARKARRAAITQGLIVSRCVAGVTNGYFSFFVAPDGSKEGWDTSNAYDERRARFIEWMDEQRREDASSSLAWAELQYGDDELDTRITAHSDQPKRRKYLA